MTNTSAEAFAPASMGNLGVGFDILGLAFLGIGDTVRAEIRDDPGVAVVSVTGTDSEEVPRDAALNTAAVAVNAFLNTTGTCKGTSLIIKKGLPIASGLGGSAASAVAAAVAANALFGNPLSRQELLPACVEGEAVVSGYHLDNVGPSLLGGITLITDADGPRIRHLPVPPGMFFALITPDIEITTAKARAVLPQSVSLKKMVAQTAAVARLIDALHRRDIVAVAAAMEQDGIIEPERAQMIPEFYRIRETAKSAGALGVAISGAGPTLCAICQTAESAEYVADTMYSVYRKAGISSVNRVTQVDEQGARVIMTH